MGSCYFCGATLDDDFYCFGCEEFICETHGDSPWGKHSPDDHALPTDDDFDNDDVD